MWPCLTVILLDTSQELGSDRDETSSIDIDINDLPHPDTLFFWAGNNHDAGSHKSPPNMWMMEYVTLTLTQPPLKFPRKIRLPAKVPSVPMMMMAT